MQSNGRLSDKEYEGLSLEYEYEAPELSGKSGFLSSMRESALVAELLPPDYARIVNMTAKALSLSPSEVIQNALKTQLAEQGDGLA